MTDITELAQSEINDALAQLKQISEYPTPSTQYARVLRKYILALVEALEKAQAGEKQWREVVDAFCADDADWHKLTNSNNELIALLSQVLCKQADHIAELETYSNTALEFREAARDENRHLKLELEIAEKRIAELESRTVNVENLQESAYRAGLTAGWNLGLANNNDGFNKCLAAHTAGIKVEADSLDAEGSNRNQPGMVVAVHIDVGDFVKFRGQVYEVKETDFDDHDVTLWFVCGEVLKCAAGCPIEVVSAPVEDE
ncbi:TPA: hypothetical protein NO558_001664 [Klebsiella pneumoniae]|nr:hypothetical protein [Klebsiella pneumoniae]